MKTMITCLIFTIISGVASAHALWIETPSFGTNGKNHEARVFLGEYAANERDSIDHWFSNMKDFKLWLVAPDGKKTELKTAAKGNYFTANFTPDNEGVYYLIADHSVAKVYDGTKIFYHAQAAVKVGNSTKGQENGLALNEGWMVNDVDKPIELNKPFAIQLLHKKSPVNDGKVSVQSAEGWAKTFSADKSGKMSFEPVWKGSYLLEGTFSEKATGKHEDQEFTSVWHCVTNCVTVN